MNDLDLIAELLADPTVLTVEAERLLPPPERDRADREPAPTPRPPYTRDCGGLAGTPARASA